SENLTDWEYLHPLVQGGWSGVSGSNPVGTGEMWECPDFFALDGKHVLIYSTMGKVFWQSGAFDLATLKFHAEQNGLIDLDAFYAPKTQLDAQGRRILWGWVPERRSQQEMLKAGWSGMMSLPRVLHLDRDGTLRMEMLPELSKLRRGSLRPAKGTSRETSQAIPNATGEMLCAGDGSSDLKLSISAGDQILMDLSYSGGTHSWIADGNPVTLPSTDLPKAHAFVDGSVIELVLNERISYTKRFYYPGRIAPDVTVHLTGASPEVNAWAISPISGDRLTSISST
ncbi:MAG TPA: glycoside hydrolase family 32 protein, partial [Edaphobacter sp.]|nr:glycoside hydrolase family 32 protein [Edaphobacter sp.]